MSHIFRRAIGEISYEDCFEGPRGPSKESLDEISPMDKTGTKRRQNKDKTKQRQDETRQGQNKTKTRQTQSEDKDKTRHRQDKDKAKTRQDKDKTHTKAKTRLDRGVGGVIPDGLA